MTTLLSCRSANARKYARALRTEANALLRILELDRCELSLVLTDDDAIRVLNRDFRAKDKPTDVLSFPQFEDHDEVAANARSPRCQNSEAATNDAPPTALGDIVISIDTASRQAAKLGQSVAARLRTLLIHGLLHLLGYDHERSPVEARRMFARERQLAAQLPQRLLS